MFYMRQEHLLFVCSGIYCVVLNTGLQKTNFSI
uniref:Uncharacterized protein n=1 Tax=Anguilla anguilla TaxID=7936 RepID=A0A0E9TQN3_ANGAN